MNSRNHIMQGAIGAWLYTDVAGIAQAPNTQAWSSLLLWPRVTSHEALPSATGSYEAISGLIEVAWANASTSFTLSATVPVNTRAEVRIPFPAGSAASSLLATEGGATFFSAGSFVPGVAGITGASVLAELSVLSVQVGSGLYSFALSW